IFTLPIRHCFAVFCLFHTTKIRRNFLLLFVQAMLKLWAVHLLSELFNTGEEVKDVHSMDKSLMEKVIILENLEEDEKKGIYSID
ncbi:MAG: hypothetical protein EAZ50_12745, partial [Runella slithyformis]